MKTISVYEHETAEDLKEKLDYQKKLCNSYKIQNVQLKTKNQMLKKEIKKNELFMQEVIKRDT